jgi:hypothetical protein
MDSRGFVGAVASLAMATGCLGEDKRQREDERQRVDISVTDEKLELPRDGLTVESRNEGEMEFTTTPTALIIKKRVGDGYHWIYPNYHTFTNDGPAHTLESGDSITWDVKVSNEPDFGDNLNYSVGGLGPGEYIFEHAYRREEYIEGSFDAPSARFEVVGEPPELEPTGVQELKRRDDAITVRTEWEGDGEVTLRETEEETPHLLILEQVVRIPLLRNLIYYADEGESVTVTNASAALELMDARLRTVGSPSTNVRSFEYDGTAYELET